LAIGGDSSPLDSFVVAESSVLRVKLTNEVNPMDLFSAVFSALAAIWLGWYITRKLSAQKFEEEYIIADM
jgi:hypothetical protein